MANCNPPKKNQAFTFTITLQDINNADTLLINPTIAAGDFKLVKDQAFGSPANPGTTPVGTASSPGITVTLTATEMNADIVDLFGIDQSSPKAFPDFHICILTTA